MENKNTKPSPEGVEGILEKFEGLWEYVVTPNPNKIFTGHASMARLIKDSFQAGEKAERERARKMYKSSVWLKGSYGQARLKKESYLNGYNQALTDLLKEGGK